MDELRAYNPSLNDRIAQFLLGDSNAGSLKGKMVEGLMGSTGLGKTQAGVVDFVPGVSNVLFGDQAVRDLAHGNYSGAAWNIAGAIPGSLATAAFSRVGKAALSSMGKAAQDAENIASRIVPAYTPPAKSLRPFEADYPNGAPSDAAGNLTHDIDGRPLTASYVAGRRLVGGSDVSIQPAEVRSIGEEATGRRIATLPPGEKRGTAGFLELNRYSRQPEQIFLSGNLNAGQADRVLSHEVGHVVDQAAGEIPTDGLSRELRPMYNTLNTGQERTRNLTGPEHLGYKGDEIPREHMADAIRAYMSDPNYIKTVAPKTAARIRQFVNDNPNLKNIIQFNSVAAAGGAGALAMQPDEAKGAEMSKFHITAPDGSEYEVEGENQEGALAALQQHLGSQSASQSPEFQQGLSEMSALSNPAYDNSYFGAGETWLNHASDFPVVGPALQKASDFIGSNLWGAATGQDPAAIRQKVDIDRKVRDNQYPMSAMSGTLAANVAPMVAANGVPEVAELMGTGGKNVAKRILASGLSNAALSGADTLARGGDAGDAAESELLSGGLGLGISGLGEAVAGGLSAVAKRFGPTIGAMLNPEKEAARRVGSAMLRDREVNPSLMLNDDDIDLANKHNIPLVNADYGGETVRALARSTANQSPEARAMIEKTADDRFATQSARASDFVKNLAGGYVDDLGYHDLIRQQARMVNEPAYRKAFSDPNAASVFSDGISDLMQSPSFRKAMDDVPARSADRGALTGQKAIPMPFAKNEFGDYVIKRNPDGSVVTPSLEFWDHTKRNLDSMITTARRGGDNEGAGTLTAIKRKLLGELDGLVPSYESARRGAAGYFDAEDALEAGKKFASNPRSLPEAQRAHAKFTTDEKRLFMAGHASEQIDRIKASGDRTNVINRMFKSQAARESNELAYGPQKAKELEAYVRVEDLADRLRGSMGNSSTVRQLAEMGAGALLGGYSNSNDGVWGVLKGGAMGAGAAHGARYLGEAIDKNAMIQVANLLSHNNPGALQVAVKLASQRPAIMRALETFSGLLGSSARGASLATPRILGQDQRQPLEMTVHPSR
ncbi:hypothetical protein [Brucella anthropi]|uniref:hypothetical protein n=1 Tax=Brucella anthropi TaxID=529 RepID=UPI002361B211|nr:hypothetical protein [Brucella anthropi]